MIGGDRTLRPGDILMLVGDPDPDTGSYRLWHPRAGTISVFVENCIMCDTLEEIE